jgi:hypothetical protein
MHAKRVRDPCSRLTAGLILGQRHDMEHLLDGYRARKSTRQARHPSSWRTFQWLVDPVSDSLELSSWNLDFLGMPAELAAIDNSHDLVVRLRLDEFGWPVIVVATSAARFPPSA